MPLERHIDDLTARDGIKFWMSDGECPVLCRVSHEALRDLAERVHFEGTDENVFEAYRELIEQVRVRRIASRVAGAPVRRNRQRW